MRASNARTVHSLNVGNPAISGVLGEIRSSKSISALTGDATGVVGILDTTNIFHRSTLSLTAGGALKPGMLLGAGLGAADVNLYRESAGVLKTTSSFSLFGNLTISKDSDPRISIYAANTSSNSSRTDSYFSRGSVAFPTAVVSGDLIWQNYGYGHDGTSYVEAASIIFGTTGTIAANRVGGYISFRTHPDSTTAVAEVLRIKSEGLFASSTSNISIVAQTTSASSYARSYVEAVAAGPSLANISFGTSNFGTYSSTGINLAGMNLLESSGAGSTSFMIAAIGGAVPIYLSTNSVVRMTLLPSGFLGVGTVAHTPISPLDVRINTFSDVMLARFYNQNVAGSHVDSIAIGGGTGSDAYISVSTDNSADAHSTILFKARDTGGTLNTFLTLQGNGTPGAYLNKVAFAKEELVLSKKLQSTFTIPVIFPGVSTQLTPSGFLGVGALGTFLFLVNLRSSLNFNFNYSALILVNLRDSSFGGGNTISIVNIAQFTTGAPGEFNTVTFGIGFFSASDPNLQVTANYVGGGASVYSASVMLLNPIY